MHCLICIVLYALHCILCIVFYALYSMHCILCIVFYALYSIHCIVLCVLYSMHCILCSIFYALYYLYCILCDIVYALYYMHCINGWTINPDLQAGICFGAWQIKPCVGVDISMSHKTTFSKNELAISGFWSTIWFYYRLTNELNSYLSWKSDQIAPKLLSKNTKDLTNL
jgi:hypothetical protein